MKSEIEVPALDLEMQRTNCLLARSVPALKTGSCGPPPDDVALRLNGQLSRNEPAAHLLVRPVCQARHEMFGMGAPESDSPSATANRILFRRASVGLPLVYVDNGALR